MRPQPQLGCLSSHFGRSDFAPALVVTSTALVVTSTALVVTSTARCCDAGFLCSLCSRSLALGDRPCTSAAQTPTHEARHHPTRPLGGGTPDPEPISPTRSHSCLPACPCWFEVVHGGRAARPPPLAALLHARSHTRAPSRIPSRAGMASHQGFPRHDSYRRRCVRALLPRPRLRVRRKLTTELAAHATI